MNSRERIQAIIAGKEADRCGFWLGNPDEATWPHLCAYFGIANQEQLRQRLQDDVRWICPQFFESTYRHPDGHAMFDLGLGKKRHGQAGPLADCQTVDEVMRYPWPNPDYLSFNECLAHLRAAGEVYRASGFWTCFYHNVMDLFGFESYMINMKLNPELIQTATDQVCGFYYEANRRFFDAAGDLMDGFFFGNDFGTQLDLICGPEDFDAFIMPWFVRFTELAHEHGYQAILHSCGAIHKVIDRLIDAGVDCLHPLQARAVDMDAETLARDYGGRVAFMGGVDTQDLLVNGTPAQVKADVCRLKTTLGPRLIISPSHEALLPNVPPENVEAMAQLDLR